MEQRDTTVRDLGEMLARQRKTAVVTFLLILAAGASYLAVAPRAYRSEGLLYLRLGRENTTLDPLTTMRSEPVVVVPQSREDELASTVDILQSRVLVERVVDELGVDVVRGLRPLSNEEPFARQSSGLDLLSAIKSSLSQVLLTLGISDPLTPHEIAVTEVMSGLQVSRKRGSNVVNVAYDSENPRLSQVIVDRLMDQFLQHHAKLNRPKAAHSFLSEQREQLLANLTRAEESVKSLKETTGLISPKEQRQALVAQIAGLEDNLRQSEAGLVSVQTENRSLTEILAGLPEEQITLRTDGFTDQGTDGIRQQFYALQVRERELAAKYSENHPSLQTVRQQLAEAAALLKEEPATRQQVTTGVNRGHEEIKLMLMKQEPTRLALQSKVESLRKQLDEARAQLSKLNVDELALVRAERELSVHESDYRNYTSALEQARVEDALFTERISNIQIAQPASLQTRPVSPRKPLLAAATLMAALGSSLLSALGVDRYRHWR